jgi:hypothetical protein
MLDSYKGLGKAYATATEVSKALHMAVVAAKSTSTMAAARDEAAPATFLAKKTQEETNEASCRHFFSPFCCSWSFSGDRRSFGGLLSVETC